MSIRSKLVGSCDALLLAVVAVLQIALLFATAEVSDDRGAATSIVAEQRHVEVVVVEASKIYPG